MPSLTFILALALTAPATAPPTPAAVFTEWVQPLVERGDLAGAVLVRRQGRDLVHQAFGPATLEPRRANHRQTRFAIGSITKQFTAAAVLRLRDAGRLRLEDDVARHLPGVEAPVGIRLLDLLTHRSGVVRDVPEELQALPTAELCRRLVQRPPAFEPGSRTAYSNGAYRLLACVVEAVAQQPFEAYLRRSFFEPLGMRHTDFWLGGPLLPDQARGHDPAARPGKIRPTPDQSLRHQLGASGIVSTVGELALWVEGLTQGRVLGPRSTEQMLSDAGNGRGLGVGRYLRGGRRVIGHDGVTHGYTAFLEWYPDEETVIAYAGNIRTSAYEYVEDALGAVAFGDELPTVELPGDLRPSGDRSLLGSYRVHDELTLDVELRDDVLELRGTGGHFTPLFQVEGDRYWYPALYAALEFRRDAGGKAASMTWTTVQGQSFEISRVDD